MKYKNVLIVIILLSTTLTGCMNDEFEDLAQTYTELNSGNKIKITTDNTTGVISLSVDAPINSRAAVWIDLNGDGVRSGQKEDIKVFNQYHNYKLTPGVRTVSLYGDITYLGGADNNITKIDVLGNQNLVTLNIPQNHLNTLDLSLNKSLQRLDCSGNQIQELNLTNNIALNSVWVYDNRLKSLDLSMNPNLYFLDCSDNLLSSIDISRNTALVRMICFNNLLTTLDISNNNQLNLLWSYGNKISESETDKIAKSFKDVPGADIWLRN